MTPLNEFEVIPINCLWEEPSKLIQVFKIMDEQDEDRYWRITRQPLNLKNIYFPAPCKGGAHLPKFAVWQPSNMSFGSVLIPNYEDGLIQLMRHLNRRFHVRYFSAYFSREHKNEGICRFEYADAAGTQRVVQVILDRGWEFYDQGIVLPFEKLAYYQNRRISDRLTPAIIVEYLQSLGWNLEDEAFWKSENDAWIVDKKRF